MKKKVEQKKRKSLQSTIDLVAEKTNISFEFGGAKSDYFGSSNASRVSIDYTNGEISGLSIARGGVSSSHYSVYDNEDIADLIAVMRKIVDIADALDTLKA